MAYRTLGALRDILRARLGFGAQGSASGANQTLLNSFLSNGQVQLYRTADWRHLTDYEDKELGVSQNLIDYPATGTFGAGGCSRDKRVLRVEVPISGRFTEIKEGITTDMWSTMDTQGDPCRYERFKQILLYPKANKIYSVRVWYVADLLEFTDDAHEATLDDEMILLHALTTGKAHYRQPDAKLYDGQLNALLASLRGQSFGMNGIYRRGEPPAAMRRPLLLGRDA